MWTPVLKLWEALGEPLGILIVVLIFCVVIWAWRREVQRFEEESKERRAREKEDRAEFRAQLERIRTESKEQFESIRTEAKERADRDSEQNARDNARLASAIEVLQGDVKGLQGEVKGLHGDVKVLLDRSNRPEGDEAGGGQSVHRYGVARQATPDQCEDDAKSSSDQPVAQPPVDSAAENPAD